MSVSKSLELLPFMRNWSAWARPHRQ